ncbi:MAG: LLM class flavin-dependent oxidoreductase [Deltaproteobacteria bacterium]|nr:MAG: LLM class flavin-dependent oxidoreductase [Deltaproteobacteria bacterium]
MARRIAMSFDWQGTLDRDAVFERARTADGSGVDSLWVAEAWGRDAFSLLTQLAERTERVKLGTGIVNIYSRTPAALAQHFATLDELSNGRAIIGLGNSGPRVIEHFHGVPFQPAFRRMRETVELLRAFFRHERVFYEGELFKLERGFTLRFEPVRKEVPIYLATLNPRSVRMTAEIADGWLPTMIPIAHLEREVAQVRDWVRSAGRDADAFTVRAPGGVTVANAPQKVEAARQRAAGTLAFYCARMGDFYLRQLTRHGFGDAAATVKEAWNQGGAAAGVAALPPDMLDHFGFVGGTEACIERLERQQAAGVTLHGVGVMEDDPRELGRILEKLVG